MVVGYDDTTFPGPAHPTHRNESQPAIERSPAKSSCALRNFLGRLDLLPPSPGVKGLTEIRPGPFCPDREIEGLHHRSLRYLFLDGSPFVVMLDDVGTSQAAVVHIGPLCSMVAAMSASDAPLSSSFFETTNGPDPASGYHMPMPYSNRRR